MAWVLFICVWRASACSPCRELCCLDGETGHRACTKNPFWYCHWHIQESRPNAENLFPLNSCRLLLRLKCIFSHVVGVFHVVYCNDKKKKMQFWICHERHVFIATQIRLHSCYWVSQSLYSWLSILWMHQLYTPFAKSNGRFFQTQKSTWCPQSICTIFGGCMKCM